MGKLQDKAAIVTGAASGIGFEIAKELAAQGCAVVICDIADPAGAVDRLRAGGARAAGVAGDISDPATAQAAVDLCVATFGRLDILVNNAGIFTSLKPQAFDQIDLAEWRRVLDVNVTGPYLFCRAALPAMRKAGGGRVVNITSSTVMMGAPRLLHYVSSKGALTAMTRSLAREMGPDKITVNAIAPGFTLSEGVLKENQPYLASQSDRSRASRSIARDQVPADLVGAVAFFASDDSAFISGQTLVVDGGAIFN